MVTAETSKEMVMGAREYQPDAYLTKPLNRAMLEKRLGAWFSNVVPCYRLPVKWIGRTTLRPFHNAYSFCPNNQGTKPG